MKYRILIVERNRLLRECLTLMLSKHFLVVGEAADGKEGLAAAQALLPDVVLIDIALPEMNGVAVTASIKQQHPDIRVLILTALKTQEHLRESLRVGADGFVFKDVSCDELVSAIKAVAGGNRYLSSHVSGFLVEGFLNPNESKGGHSPLEHLTVRERSVLKLVAEGRTNRSVGEFLDLSPKTVEKHRAQLMRKLGLRSAGELILAAMELGLVDRPNTVLRLAEDSIV